MGIASLTRYDLQPMIRHIVLWRLKAEAHGRFEEIRAALQAQLGRIPGLERVEVGRNLTAGRRSVDFALVCDFANRAALEEYHRHPAHRETRSVVDPLVDEHWIADYEP
jgi:heme-degrading monooxygenase HmoA